MIIISRTLVLSQVQTYNADNPVIGWDNLVTINNIAATSAVVNFPASNLANPVTSTDQEWRATSTADQYLTVTTGRVDPIDYVALGRHNLGSTLATVSVEGQAIEGGSWVEIVQEQILPDDSPSPFRFAPQSLFAVRIKIQPVATAPKAAVMYVGALLVMERGLWVGHTPLKYAVQVNAIDGLAESGDNLGSIVIGEWRDSPARFRGLSPTFFRTKMWPFLNVATRQRRPFFIVPRPCAYPLESGFAHLTNNPVPVPTAPNQYEIELQMRGIS